MEMYPNCNINSAEDRNENEYEEILMRKGEEKGNALMSRESRGRRERDRIRFHKD